jgi:hypothetical protein
MTDPNDPILSLAFAAGAWAQEFVPDANTSLLLHFNSSLASTDGRHPTSATGVTFEPGVFGNGAFLGGAGSLSYDSSVLTPSVGTIEFWIKPRWPGNDDQTHVMLSVPGKLVITKDANANLRFLLGADDSEAREHQPPELKAAGSNPAGRTKHSAVPRRT